MFVARRKKILTNALALRVTEEESQRIRRSAAQAGLTVSEWGRQVVLESLDCPPWARLLLGEFLALRSVVVDLHNDLLQGVQPSNERLKAILDVADKRKFEQADRRLTALTPAKKN
jgi:predicted HicB family RNase H-like nuclease